MAWGTPASTRRNQSHAANPHIREDMQSAYEKSRNLLARHTILPCTHSDIAMPATRDRRTFSPNDIACCGFLDAVSIKRADDGAIARRIKHRIASNRLMP